jgi:hypothetical protein
MISLQLKVKSQVGSRLEEPPACQLVEVSMLEHHIFQLQLRQSQQLLCLLWRGVLAVSVAPANLGVVHAQPENGD